MSASDVIGRIQEIKTTLTQMTTPVSVSIADPAPAATVNTASAEAFAKLLTSAAPSSATSAASPASALSTVTSAAGPASRSIDFEAASAKYIGLPYIWGGNDPAAGLDCSSFVQNVYKDLGYDLPRTTWDQINTGTPVASMADARPGDLLFSHDTGHVSIYLGNGKAVDAPQPGTTIQIRDAWENDGNISGIRRVIPDAVQDAGAAPVTNDLLAAAQTAFLSGASL